MVIYNLCKICIYFRFFHHVYIKINLHDISKILNLIVINLELIFIYLAGNKDPQCRSHRKAIKKIIFLLLSYLNFYTYRISVPNKKENIENLQKKLGEVLGLERAAQKAVTELISMKLLKSGSKTEAEEIQEEASTHEEKIQEVVSIFSDDKDVRLDIGKVEESAKETEEKATKIMKTYLGEEPDTPEALEFLCLAEGGEVTHYEVLQAICGNFDNKKALSTVKSILKEEQRHLTQCIDMAKAAVS